MVNDIISCKFKELVGEKSVLLHEQMSNHTSFKVGGPADYLLLPNTEDEIKSILTICNEEKIPFYIMGNGSNLLVGDKGYRGAIIKIYKNYNQHIITKDLMDCQAGILLSEIANFALKNSLSGFEFASGIPGTLGGAVTMNAGAYGGEMKDVLISAHVIDKQGNISEIINGDLELGYRTSSIQKNDMIVLSAKIQLKKASIEDIKLKMNELDNKRKSKQPLEWPSAGSTFKRPEGYYAGKLIEDSGLKGFELGGAKVSDKHCGFIINKGNATSKDILDLVCHIKKVVYEKFGVVMQPEVKIIGEK